MTNVFDSLAFSPDNKLSRLSKKGASHLEANREDFFANSSSTQHVANLVEAHLNPPDINGEQLQVDPVISSQLQRLKEELLTGKCNSIKAYQRLNEIVEGRVED